MPLSQPKRIAIIGGGCSGVFSFWALQRSLHDVHLFEASSTLGGRIKTVPFESNGEEVDVDTESPAFNARASPNLVSLLRHLNIPTSEVPFCFSASDGFASYIWCDGILKSILQQPWVLLNPQVYRVLIDALWLKFFAVDILAEESRIYKNSGAQHSFDTHAYLAQSGCSSSFLEKYLAPLLSIMWRTNAGRFLPRFPADVLIRTLRDHQMLASGDGNPDWRHIDMGVNKLMHTVARGFPKEKVHLNAKVQAINRLDKERYNLLTANGYEMRFDHIIFAVDGPEIIRILQSCLDVEERAIIGGLETARNIGVLHSDPFLAPGPFQSAPECSYILDPENRYQHRRMSSDSNLHKSCLTYNINVLQGIPASKFGRIYMTLNPFTPPNPRLVQGVWEFTDPELSTTTLDAQARLPSIQNKNGLSYCFSWSGRGLLEDSLSAALKIAQEHLDAPLPFRVHYPHDPLELDEAPLANLRIQDQWIRVILRLFYIYFAIVRLFIAIFRLLWTMISCQGRLVYGDQGSKNHL